MYASDRFFRISAFASIPQDREGVERAQQTVSEKLIVAGSSAAALAKTPPIR